MASGYPRDSPQVEDLQARDDVLAAIACLENNRLDREYSKEQEEERMKLLQVLLEGVVSFSGKPAENE
jgi:hypothetical protein